MSEDKNLKANEEKPTEVTGEEVIEPEIKYVVEEEITEEVVEDKKSDTSKKGKTKTAIIIAVVGIICLGAGFVYGKEVGRKLPATTKSYSSSKVIATIGESKITGEDLQKRMEPLFYLNGKSALTEEQITAYEASMIDYMTTTEVLYLEGKEKKVEATEDEIKTEYDGLMSSIEQKFAMTKDDFLKQFSLTEESIKADLEKEIIATKYIGQASEVSDTEAQNYYDKNKEEFLQVRASHILIKNTDDEGNKLSEEQNKANKEKAQGILDKVKAGEDFASLAKEYSQDSSAANGGDLEFFGKGQMVKPFEESVFALKVGDISPELVESEFGYHIIKKTDEKYDDFADIKEDLKYNLSYEKQNTLITDLLEKYNVGQENK